MKTLACDCVKPTIKEAFEESEAVFSGEVVGFEYRKGMPHWAMDEQTKVTGKAVDYETLVVKVRVNRWWKNEPPTEVYLLTEGTRNADGTLGVSSCDYIFHKGETYLIFASQFNTKKENEYRTSGCSRTRQLSAAEDDLKILGEGKKTSENKDKPNNSMDVRAKQRLSFCIKNAPLRHNKI
jgi:hypothetical protein